MGLFSSTERVLPTPADIDLVWLKVCSDHGFCSLVSVRDCIFEKTGRLVLEDKLWELLEADERFWVTPRLDGIEGQSRAVVSREWLYESTRS